MPAVKKKPKPDRQWELRVEPTDAGVILSVGRYFAGDVMELRRVGRDRANSTNPKLDFDTALARAVERCQIVLAALNDALDQEEKPA